LAGNQILGPAIIEETTATTLVDVGQQCEVDRFGNLIIHINHKEEK
jgi:N-methylhydantoinase A/oxoprolinase/acetone carboxylase beta subunit